MKSVVALWLAAVALASVLTGQEVFGRARWSTFIILLYGLTSLLTFVQLLRTLEQLDFLNGLVTTAEINPVALARLTAYLDPLHRRALLPRGYDEQAIIADLLLEFVEMHCPHLLGQAGPSAAGYPPGPPPAVAGPT